MLSRLSIRNASGLVVALLASTNLVIAGPCDIYASGKTPCVAAHSTTRALYSAYSGGLYQVLRSSDKATTDIRPLSAGGVANAAIQDSFCQSTTCLINKIYDQSGHGNHLSAAPPGEFKGPNSDGTDFLSSATGAPVTLNGQKAYGVFISPGGGYRNNHPKGIATKDDAEGIYAVFDGTHYSHGCCFDYGNAEKTNHDDGDGTMETLYFGLLGVGKPGRRPGPWIKADMENGVFTSNRRKGKSKNGAMRSRFVTATLKGKHGKWAIRGGDATKGVLTTFFSGARPSKDYHSMKKQGGIVLGIGGDNSNKGQGTFYEGVITSGFPDDKTEEQVQQNIVEAKYNTTSLTSGPALQAGKHIAIRVTTPKYTNRYIAHTDADVNTQVVSGSSLQSLKQQASWIVRTGLGNSACWSFESVDSPGHYMRHTNYTLKLNKNETMQRYREEATFCNAESLKGKVTSFYSWSYPARYIRHYYALLYIASDGGPFKFDARRVFNDDVSFVVSTGFA